LILISTNLPRNALRNLNQPLQILVEKNKNEEGEVVKDNEPEVAIHVSASARALIEENDLDASLIEGTGKKGQIIKPDVIAHLEALAVSNEELPEEAPDAEEILTHR